MKLYRRGGVWWVSHGTGAGRLRQSTGEADYQKAQDKAREICAPAMLRSQASRIEAAARQSASLRAAAAEAEGRGVTWEEAWRRFPRCGRGGEERGKGTMDDYARRWRSFAGEMALRGFARPGDVPREAAREWLLSRGARARVYLHTVLGAVYRACGLEPPFGERPRRKAGAVVHRQPLTREQVRALLEACDAAAARRDAPRISPEYRPMLLTMLYTGLRLGDAATLTAGMVDVEGGWLERRMAKTGRAVRFPLHPALLAELAPRAEAAGEGGELFPDLAQIQRHGQGGLSKQIHRLMRAAGILDGAHAPGEFCAHCLRTTFASMCAERGVPLGVIQSWLGHASQEVTRIYARVEDMRAKAAAIARLPDLG